MVCSLCSFIPSILGLISRVFVNPVFIRRTRQLTGSSWITVWAWITVTAASPAYLSNIVTGLAIFNYPDYIPQRWHGTLIMWGFVVVPVVWNFWFRSKLNTIEMIGRICHAVFFVISIITLVVLAEKSSAGFVFNTLWHGISGWNNPGVAFSIGLITVTFPITSFDGILHMSKCTKPEKSLWLMFEKATK